MAYREGATAKEKRSMFKKLFSSDSNKSSKSSKDGDKKKLNRGHTIANPGTREKKEKGDAEGASGRTKSLKTHEKHGSERERSNRSERPPPQEKKGGKKGRRKKQKKGMATKVDTSKPLDWPAEPELVLEYHKQKPFLTPNEEWLLMELNEYECLVDSKEIISIMAQHSKYIDLEPPEYLDEFFEFVDDVSTYDEILNYDVWQEFRDVKYPC